MGSKILKGARRVQILAQFGHSSSSCQTKNFKMYAVSSKFKKIARKFKKYEIFWHQRGWGAQGACNFFLRFYTVGARGEKKPNLAQKKTLKNALFCFFARAPRMSFDQKNCKRLAHPSLFDARKIHTF